MSDLEDRSDNDVEIFKKQDSNNIKETIIYSDADIEYENANSFIGGIEDTNTNDMSKFDNHVYRWRSSQPSQLNTEFLGNQFSLPPTDFETAEPFINQATIKHYMKDWKIYKDARMKQISYIEKNNNEN
ncbi:uncharacterized protein LOC124818620 [Hydra vulgaris]|uniref:uncharacterized protein LOC124818620 n=1 Tax=Hydra vulgaris TaxID=6087 RepID=UPI001F5FBC25|nr:uncharacterized protein LOC124818620 [Hydra vulgaris]